MSKGTNYGTIDSSDLISEKEDIGHNGFLLNSNNYNFVERAPETTEDRLNSLVSGTIYSTNQLVDIKSVISAWIKSIQGGITTPPIFQCCSHPTGVEAPFMCLGTSPKDGTLTGNLIHHIRPDAWESMARQVGLETSICKSLFANTDFDSGYFIIDVFECPISSPDSTEKPEKWGKYPYHILLLPVTIELHKVDDVKLYSPPTTSFSEKEDYLFNDPSKNEIIEGIEIAEARLRSLLQPDIVDTSKAPIQRRDMRFKVETPKKSQEGSDDSQVSETTKKPLNFSSEWWATAEKVKRT